MTKSLIAAAIIGLTSTTAIAQQAPFRPSHDQVVAELRQAQRLGQVSIGESDSNWKLEDVAEATTTTRAQVVAELRDAQRDGSVSLGESDSNVQITDLRSEISITRAQVVAELREAQRLGLVSFGEGDVPVATAEQERLIADAGRRVAEQYAVASR